jgi:TorA maturation chaperone TorD
VENLILINMANLSNMLTALYCEPHPEYFRDKTLHSLLLENTNNLDVELNDYATKMVNSLETIPHIELLKEYTRLFLGPFEIIAHPYASVYLDGYTLDGE